MHRHHRLSFHSYIPTSLLTVISDLARQSDISSPWLIVDPNERPNPVMDSVLMEFFDFNAFEYHNHEAEIEHPVMLTDVSDGDLDRQVHTFVNYQ